MEFKPHPYQEYGIKRVIDTKALGLMLDMGLGKTIITLTAFKELKFHRFEVAKALVIAPKKVAESTWTEEVNKWKHLRDIRVNLVLGTQKQRIKALNTPGDIWVINRENVEWLVNYYQNQWPFDMVIIDEMSSFKNHRAKRFKALNCVRPHINRIVGLTGTPAPNGLIDLWAQIYLLDRGERLGKYISHYRERYFNPGHMQNNVVFNYRLKKGSEESIQEKISDICVSMKSEDYLTLPERIDNIIPVKLNDKAQKEYNDFERIAVLDTIEGEVTATSAAALNNKLLQLANGAVYTDEEGYAEINKAKLDVFVETVEALNGKSALVFYNFRHDLERIQKALKKLKLRVKVLKDDEDVKAWNRGEIDILLTHPASAAYGLNLQQGGHNVIWFGLNYSLELYQQANKRLHRQGQRETVYIHHLVTEGTRDEDVIKALQGKADVQDELLESLKARIKKYEREERSNV